MRYATAVIVLSLAGVHSSLAAQSTQVVSGRVLSDSTAPLAGAVVSVTMAPERILRQDTTHADGRWRITFTSPTGDYLVHIAAPGRTAFRKRVTAPATDSLVIVDATLALVVQELAPVKVEAQRPKPEREGDVYTPDPASSEYLPYGIYGAVTPDLAGNLAAMANTIPGLSAVPGGVSAFGLDPSQSSTTLNGLSFPGASLPRNASTSTRFTTSTYDPARGGFAGVETAVTLSQGTINTHRTANLTFDAPMLQLSDGRHLGQRVTAGQASIGGSGAWVEDRWYYNASADFSRRISDAPSLLGADASLFPLAGIAPDSVTRLLSTLSTLRIPASVIGAPTQNVNDKLSFAVRVDHAPYLPQSFSPNPHTW
jgi:Carboxypeptidase regulatory-like domain